jgi:peptide/nickel transport system substrate-binding protein
MVAQLEAGTLDAIPRPPLRDAARLRADPKYQVQVLQPSGSIASIGFNVTYGPFNNKLVRQALNYAIDRKRIAETALLSFSQPQDLPWSASSAAAEPAKNTFYSFDLDKAKSLLKQAGVDGFEMDFYTMGSIEGPIVGQIYQADLAKIGVKLAIQDVTAAVWTDQINGVKYRGQWWSSLSLNHLSPGTMLITSVPYNPSNPPNNCGYSSEVYGNLVGRIVEEPDTTRQKTLYGQLNDLLLEDSWVAAVAEFPVTQLSVAKAKDITPNLHGSWLYTDAWLDASG